MTTTTEILRCGICSREVRIVRLNSKLLGLGHVTNPANGHHPVRLSRAAAVRDGAAAAISSFRLTRSAATSLGQGDGPLNEGPDRNGARTAYAAGGPSPDRRASGRSRVPSRSMTVTRSKSPEQGRSQQDPSPAPASAQGLGQ